MQGDRRDAVCSGAMRAMRCTNDEAVNADLNWAAQDGTVLVDLERHRVVIPYFSLCAPPNRGVEAACTG